MAGVQQPLGHGEAVPKSCIATPLLLLAKQYMDRGDRIGNKPSLVLSHEGRWLKMLQSPVPTALPLLDLIFCIN